MQKKEQKKAFLTKYYYQEMLFNYRLIKTKQIMIIIT